MLNLVLLLTTLSTASAQEPLPVDCADDARNAAIAVDALNFGSGHQDVHSVIEMKDKDRSAKFEVTIFSYTNRTYALKLRKILKSPGEGKCIVESMKHITVID